MKMMKVLVALLVMAGLVAPAVAIAEDKLSISGEFRVFGFSKEDYTDFGSEDINDLQNGIAYAKWLAENMEAAEDYNDQWGGIDGAPPFEPSAEPKEISKDADDVAYFSQRLRLYAKYAVTEGVTIHTRMDFGEGTWGAAGQDTIRFENNNDLQIDRAFLEIDKERYNFRAGQQYYGFGNSIAVDHQGTGFRVSTKGPVVFTAFFNKLDENGLTDDTGTEDDDMYGASVKYKADTFAAELFYAYQDGIDFGGKTFLNGLVAPKTLTDAFDIDVVYADEDGDQSVIGLAADTKLGAVNVKGELNIFDGELDADIDTIDFAGTQLYLDANTALSSALTLGGSLFYAQGYDDKLQLTELSDFGSWLPWEYGYFETNYGLFSGSSFDPFKLNAGTVSLLVYGAYQASDDLGFKASVQYGMEEEDALAEYDYMSYNLSAQYMIAKNTQIFAQFNYLDVDVDVVELGSVDTDSAMGIAAGIQANF